MDYIRSTETVPNGVFVSPSQTVFPTNAVTTNAALGGALAVEGISPSADNHTVDNNEKSQSNDNNGGVAITIDKKFAEATLTSITAFRAWQNTQWQDYDQIGQPIPKIPQVDDVGNLSFTQFSEEDRITSARGGLIDFVAGFFYLHDEDTERYDRSLEPLTGDTTLGDARYDTVEDNVALFGEGDINVTRRFRLIAGLRVLDDNLSYHLTRVSTSPVTVSGISPSFASAGATNWFGYEDRFGWQYDLTSRVMGYFTYSRGFKGPAYNVFFNQTAESGGVLKPETSDDYELGLDQADFLADVDGALVTDLINAGSVSTGGVESDFVVTPIRNLTLSGATPTPTRMSTSSIARPVRRRAATSTASRCRSRRAGRSASAPGRSSR